MNENVKVVFGLIGGLALFLYGMNSMSDALQKAAGERMKKILGFLTRNPIMGALAGALVTAVLQSSSATTVMVIGFVSAGLMSLPQAISVIFGANIGTTMTAQLMAFKISNYIYPIIFVGFILNFVSKKEKVKNIGMVIFSFGLLFEGIEIMGEVMKPLAGSPVFVDLMGKVSSIPVLDAVVAETVFENKKKMHKAEKKYSKAHLNRVKNEVCDASMTRYFSGIMYNFDRMADNCVSIAEEACDNVAFINLDEETGKSMMERGAV